MPAPVGLVRTGIQAIMRSAAATKYPWTRLYEELKEVAPLYRKQTMGRDYRSYIAAYERGKRLKFVRRDYYPGKDLFSSSDIMMRKRFKYNVETTFVDKDGIEYSKRSQFVSSDVQLTRGQVEDIVRDNLGDIAKDYDIPTVLTTLTEAWHKEGEFWD